MLKTDFYHIDITPATTRAAMRKIAETGAIERIFAV